VTLHEVENALSIIVASMFWTCKHKGHEIIDLIDLNSSGTYSHDTQGYRVRPRKLPKWDLLWLPFRHPEIAYFSSRKCQWLYRNHPELETLLEQVEHPTDDNLRAAELVQTRLVSGRVQKERRKSF
jgi:hypothetical protein